MNWISALGLFLLATTAAIVALLFVSQIQGPKKRPKTSIFAETLSDTLFLFDGETLVDSTPGGRLLLTTCCTSGGPWVRLLSYLSDYVPDIEARLHRLADEGAMIIEGLSAEGKTLVLIAELRGGLTRMTLKDPAQDGAPFAIDALAFRAMNAELEQLRDVVTQVPVLIWRETASGDIVWANHAYLMLAVSTLPSGKDLGWPLPRLFERVASQTTVAGQRGSVTLPGEKPLWYDLVGMSAREGRLIFALPANTAVQLQETLRDFMQTLTKTFAQLPIGLAIFDKNRQLQLFNPALMYLTGLPADFLAARPSLLSVLDALRDLNMIPEPKDYHLWRKQLIEMERAASSGSYDETWNLPDGQTFRVIARPHPDSALALMVEDITHQVSSSRRYRSDLELGQAVIDEMDEAVAVFSPSGMMVMSNRAYAALWGHDPEAGLNDSTIHQVSSYWREQTAPSKLWYEVDEFISTVGNRVSWHDEARLLDGRLLNCRFVPLSGGATLAAFKAAEISDASQPRLTGPAARKTA